MSEKRIADLKLDDIDTCFAAAERSAAILLPHYREAIARIIGEVEAAKQEEEIKRQCELHCIVAALHSRRE